MNHIIKDKFIILISSIIIVLLSLGCDSSRQYFNVEKCSIKNSEISVEKGFFEKIYIFYAWMTPKGQLLIKGALYHSFGDIKLQLIWAINPLQNSCEALYTLRDSDQGSCGSCGWWLCTCDEWDLYSSCGNLLLGINANHFIYSNNYGANLTASNVICCDRKWWKINSENISISNEWESKQQSIIKPWDDRRNTYTAWLGDCTSLKFYQNIKYPPQVALWKLENNDWINYCSQELNFQSLSIYADDSNIYFRSAIENSNNENRELIEIVDINTCEKKSIDVDGGPVKNIIHGTKHGLFWIQKGNDNAYYLCGLQKNIIKCENMQAVIDIDRPWKKIKPWEGKQLLGVSVGNQFLIIENKRNKIKLHHYKPAEF